MEVRPGSKRVVELHYVAVLLFSPGTEKATTALSLKEWLVNNLSRVVTAKGPSSNDCLIVS